MDQLYEQLKNYGKVKLNEPLFKHTTFKIGGPARFLVIVRETDKLVELLNFLTGQGIDHFILGGGSNILFNDSGYEGVVVKIMTSQLSVDREMIMAEAGVQLSQVVNTAAQNGLTGMEWGVRIPGMIGGSAVGNAGAMGSDMSCVVDKIETWQDGEVKEISNQECGYRYRGSALKDSGAVVLRVYFKLKAGDRMAIITATQNYVKQRACRVSNNASAGCTFKNIDISDWPGNMDELDDIFKERGKVPAGWLIEKVGYSKGSQKGNAQISNLHANIIENMGNASQADILALVDEIKQKVYNKFKVELQEEMVVVE
ncbi:MAG: UDP-N-acetylmuramate dehydrogenase [bacterium]